MEKNETPKRMLYGDVYVRRMWQIVTSHMKELPTTFELRIV